MEHLRITRVDNVLLMKGRRAFLGTLHLTAHQLIFRYADSSDEVWVFYSTIHDVTRHPPSAQMHVTLDIRCRNFVFIRLIITHEQQANDVQYSLGRLVHVDSPDMFFAFDYRRAANYEFDGWTVYDPEAEWRRQGISTATAPDGVCPAPPAAALPPSSSPGGTAAAAAAQPPTTTADGGLAMQPPSSSSSSSSAGVAAPQGGGSPTGAAASAGAGWRVTRANTEYGLCATYPALVVIPARISDSVLRHAAKHRSKARVPALTYLHGNGASLTRCSQPLVGLKQNRSLQDERLVEAIFRQPVRDGSSAPAANLIVDARPPANAMANTAKGAGTENLDHYKLCRKEFLGIDNIHVMRDSLQRMVDAIQGAEVEGVPVNQQQLERSGWLRHIKMLLEGTQTIVDTLHAQGAHVLVHCSDGWDRTSQLCALAQVCLDPYFRTLRGFQVLVEKDWLAFGHKFSDRCGHLSSAGDGGGAGNGGSAANGGSGSGGSGGVAGGFATGVGAASSLMQRMQSKLQATVEAREVSPVFHQFLDCVFQLLTAWPRAFEFNERFLVDLHFHVYSCQYGTFLFNSDAERRAANVATRTHSLWSMVHERREQYLNAQYAGRVPLPVPEPAPAPAQAPDGGEAAPQPPPQPPQPATPDVLSCRVPRLRYWTGLLNCPADLAVDSTQAGSGPPPVVQGPSGLLVSGPNAANDPAAAGAAGTGASPGPDSAGIDGGGARASGSGALTPGGSAAAVGAVAGAAAGAVVEKVSQLWSRWTTSGSGSGAGGAAGGSTGSLASAGSGSGSGSPHQARRALASGNAAGLPGGGDATEMRSPRSARGSGSRSPGAASGAGAGADAATSADPLGHQELSTISMVATTRGSLRTD